MITRFINLTLTVVFIFLLVVNSIALSRVIKVATQSEALAKSEVIFSGKVSKS